MPIVRRHREAAEGPYEQQGTLQKTTAGLTLPPGDPRAVVTAKGSCPRAARGSGGGPPPVFRFPRGWDGAFSGPSSLGTTILRSREILEDMGAQPMPRFPTAESSRVALKRRARETMYNATRGQSQRSSVTRGETHHDHPQLPPF